MHDAKNQIIQNLMNEVRWLKFQLSYLNKDIDETFIHTKSEYYSNKNAENDQYITESLKALKEVIGQSLEIEDVEDALNVTHDLAQELLNADT